MYLKVMFVITGILLLLIAGCPQEEGGESGESAGATDQVEDSPTPSRQSRPSQPTLALAPILPKKKRVTSAPRFWTPRPVSS